MLIKKFSIQALKGYATFWMVCVASFAFSESDPNRSTGEQWFEKIQPILDQHCIKCHGTVKQKGGLNLSSFHHMTKGSENGFVLVAGKPDSSPIHRVLLPQSDPHMPPKKQLSDSDIHEIQGWIQAVSADDLTDETEDADPWETHPQAGKQIQENSQDWEPPEDMAPENVINRFVEAGWHQKNLRPSPIVDDRGFVRRVYLDLIGRIPMRREFEAFLYDGRIDKRPRLVDELLAHDDYARHMREIFDVVLMGRADSKRVTQREEHHWNQFLESAFTNDRPWNEVVRQLIIGRSQKEQDRGGFWFLYERNNDHQAIAEALAPIAYGTQIKCAQCHDHPLAGEIGQHHYWGLVAGFNRSRNVDTESGLGISESAIGGFIKFTNLELESQPARLALLSGSVIEEAWPQEGEKKADDPKLYRIPPSEEKKTPEKPSYPIFSRREAIADELTQKNHLLARAMVNRIWALFLGRGIVHPVDEMNSKHPPSHPELLDWLAKEFVDNDYQLRPLVRSIILSRPYQLSTRPVSGSLGLPEDFSVSLEKPLTAEVLWRSIRVALHGEEVKLDSPGHESYQALRRVLIKFFPDIFPVEYNTSLQQAMFLTNSPILDSLLDPFDGNLTLELLSIPDLGRRVDRAYISTFGRFPDFQEKGSSLIYLRDRIDRPEAGIKQLVWTLLTSAEFLVNH